MSRNLWVDEDFRRDWLFWAGVLVASGAVARAIAVDDHPWWALTLGWLSCFSATVGVVGFLRTVVRGYRDE